MRTLVAGVEQVGAKFAVKLETYRVDNDLNAYLMFKVKSAPVFMTDADAYAGGKRAVAMLKETGRFPNMCEAF